MNQRINKVVKFIILGMVMNFAVACLCVLFSPEHTFTFENEAIAPADVRQLSHARLRSKRRVDRSHLAAFGYEQSHLEVDRGFNSHAPITYLTRCSAGVPWYSFVGEMRVDTHYMPSPQNVHQRLCLVRLGSDLKPFIADQSRQIPYCPLPAGMLANTAVYTALLWPVLRLAAAARRRLRHRRGQCPACRYPVDVSPACTECGASLSIPSVQQSQA